MFHDLTIRIGEIPFKGSFTAVESQYLQSGAPVVIVTASHPSVTLTIPLS